MLTSGICRWLSNHHLVCSWATIAKLSDLTETLHAGLISAARAAFQSLCSYGVPLLAVALTAWTAVRFWGLVLHYKSSEVDMLHLILQQCCSAAVSCLMAMDDWMSLKE